MGHDTGIKTGSPNSFGGEKPSLKTLLQVYGKIGILGFGGGFAVLSFIRSEVVTRHHWLTEEQFDHVVEMTSFAPGPTTTNVMAAIAYRLLGWQGLVLGTVAVLWPSFLLILALSKLTRLLHSVWMVGVLRGIELAVIGLLVDVVFTLWHDVPKSWLTGGLALVAVAASLLDINPALIILLVAAVGVLDFLVRKKPLVPPKSDHGPTSS